MSDTTVSSELAQFTSTITDVLSEHTDAPQSAVSAIEEDGESLVKEVSRLEETTIQTREIAQNNRDEIEIHEKKLEYHFEDICENESRIDDIEASNPRGMSGEDGTAELHDTINADWTPIERLSIIGEESLDEHVGVSDKRAVSIFEHWDEWSTNTPKGKLLKTSDSLKSLLSTATDEHLAWKQVYRACRRIEQLSKGRITFFQHDKHGWMLKQHESFASMQGQSSTLTPSSVTS